jgi:hypothetical protein
MPTTVPRARDGRGGDHTGQGEAGERGRQNLLRLGDRSRGGRVGFGGGQRVRGRCGFGGDHRVAGAAAASDPPNVKIVPIMPTAVMIPAPIPRASMVCRHLSIVSAYPWQAALICRHGRQVLHQRLPIGQCGAARRLRIVDLGDVPRERGDGAAGAVDRDRGSVLAGIDLGLVDQAGSGPPHLPSLTQPARVALRPELTHDRDLVDLLRAGDHRQLRRDLLRLAVRLWRLGE